MVGRTFLGQLTRVSVRLSGDVVVQVDQQSTEAAGIAPGDPVDVSLAGAPVMVAEAGGDAGQRAPASWR